MSETLREVLIKMLGQMAYNVAELRAASEEWQAKALNAEDVIKALITERERLRAEIERLQARNGAEPVTEEGHVG